MQRLKEQIGPFSTFRRMAVGSLGKIPYPILSSHPTLSVSKRVGFRTLRSSSRVTCNKRIQHRQIPFRPFPNASCITDLQGNYFRPNKFLRPSRPSNSLRTWIDQLRFGVSPCILLPVISLFRVSRAERIIYLHGKAYYPPTSSVHQDANPFELLPALSTTAFSKEQHLPSVH